MRSSACVSCAKRKVRCDREEPCSNCNKRSQECVYTDDRINDRVKKLEALVLRLGGNLDQLSQAAKDAPRPSIEESEASEQSVTVKTGVDAADITNGNENPSDAAILQDESEPLYLETPIWRAWNGRYFGPVNSFKSKGLSADLILKKEESSVFASLVANNSLSFRNDHPSPSISIYLWTQFYHRVQPVIKIFFEWELIELRAKCSVGNPSLSDQQHAFVFALYGLTVQSLPEKELLKLGQDKTDMLKAFQYSCEQALVAYNFLVAYDIMTLQTLMVYLYSLFSRDKLNGLWDAFGLVLRKAERIGLHRDGAALGLSPFETEKRRRLWWCMQSMDLALAAVNGATTMNLVAEWDTKLPLNIEDSDISPRTKQTPKERPGLTSMSYCHWRYWIIDQQRNNLGPDGKRIGMSWTVDKRLPVEVRRSMIDKLEDKLSQNYTRFCDPIKSLDMAILIIARAVINFLRRATLCPGPAFKDAHEFTKEDQAALLVTSVRMLEYDRAMFTTPHLEPYSWHGKFLFPWSAFVHVLVELRQEQDIVEAEKYWSLIDTVYKTAAELQNIENDRRAIYAAGLTMEAWSHLQGLRQAAESTSVDIPSYITSFQERFSSKASSTARPKGLKRKRTSEHAIRNPTSEPETALPTPWSENLDFMSEIPMSFEDIDWSFWTLPEGDELFAGYDFGQNEEIAGPGAKKPREV